MLLLIGPMLASAGPTGPTGPGRFKAGFAHFVAIDGSRLGTSPFGSGRPVAIALFYPADTEDVGDAAPRARYPRNPVFAPQPCRSSSPPSSCWFTSSVFEAQGIDPAYERPTPAGAAPFPLVVLALGARAPWWQNVWIATRLASHGFVVAVVGHYGDGAYPGDPFHQAAQRAFDRPRDLSFAITYLLERNAVAGDLLHGLIDRDRVAAGGHSWGGYTALASAGGDDDTCDTFAHASPSPCDATPAQALVTVPDARVKALLLLDASSQQLHWDELSRVTIPAIVIGEDWTTIGAVFGPGTEIWHAREHAAIDGHPSYRVDVNRSRHGFFINGCEAALIRGGLPPGEPFYLAPAQVQTELARIGCCEPALPPGSCVDPTAIAYPTAHDIASRYAVAFLKTELGREQGYQHVLTPGWALAREPDAQFFVTERRTGIDPAQDAPTDEFWYFATQPGDRAHAAKDPAGLASVPEEPGPVE